MERSSGVEPFDEVDGNGVPRILAELLAHLGLHPEVLFDVMGPTPRIIRLTEPVGPPVAHTAPIGVVKLSRTAGLEAATYIALHGDDPPLYSTVEAITFPEHAAMGQTHLTSFMTTITTTRTALGKNRAGAPILSHKSKEGKLRFTGGLTTWRLFQLLLGEARATVDRKQQIKYLADALSLLGDEGPFARTRDRNRVGNWEWIDLEGIRTAMETAIVTAARMAAQLLMTEGDYAAARKAISKGLMVAGMVGGMVAETDAELWELLKLDHDAQAGNRNNQT